MGMIQRLRARGLNILYKPALFLPRCRYKHIGGYYRYSNSYENSDYPQTSGFVKIMHSFNKVAFIDAFSDAKSEINNYPAKWHSTFCVAVDNVTWQMSYHVTKYDSSGALLSEFNGTAITQIYRRGKYGMPNILIETFENETKGKGSCVYKKVSRKSYYNARKKETSLHSPRVLKPYHNLMIVKYHKTTA